MNELGSQVLLSYAHEDFEDAVRVYRSLTEEKINVWFDRLSLLPGQRWRDVIYDAIAKSDLFISLLSSRSVEKKGFVQAETRRALDGLLEFPPGAIYILPVRLDDCVPLHEVLRDLHWVNLYEDWGWGMKSIKASIFSQLAPRQPDQLSTGEGLAGPPLPPLLRYDGVYSGSYESGSARHETLTMRFFPGREVVIGSSGAGKAYSYDDLSMKKVESREGLLTCMQYSVKGERVEFSGRDRVSYKAVGNTVSNRRDRFKPYKMYAGLIESKSIKVSIREYKKEYEQRGYSNYRFEVLR